jgi:hypothetical protein
VLASPTVDDVGDNTQYLATLTQLDTSKPDESGKVRTVRTAKWLKKWTKLLQSVGMSIIDHVDVYLSRIGDELAKSKQYICISVNPLDFMLSATRQVCDFTSCHSLDGMHAHGNSGYVRDDHTVLVFLARRKDEAFPFFKTGRAWVYIGQDDQILMGRAYGRGVTRQLASFVVRHPRSSSGPVSRGACATTWRWTGARSTTSADGACSDHHRYSGWFDEAMTRVAIPLSYLVRVAPTHHGDEEDEEHRRCRGTTASPTGCRN